MFVAQNGMLAYVMKMMTSWAIVCDVWYLPPMTREEVPNPSVADPGCLSRIRLFSIPDPNCLHPGSASKNGFETLENMIRVVHPG
jgi:hypothetical protein